MSDLSDCTKCHAKCMGASGISLESCMKMNCPQCLSSGPSGVCANQKTFDHAFRKAIKYNNMKNKPKAWSQWVMIAILFIFIVWAFMVVSKLPSGPSRVMHYFLALVAAPFYLIAYYVGMPSKMAY